MKYMKYFMYLGFLGLFMFVYSANNDTSNNNTSNNNPQNIREKPPNKCSNEYFIDITNKNNVFWQYSDENFMLIEFLKVPLANYGTDDCVNVILEGKTNNKDMEKVNPSNSQKNTNLISRERYVKAIVSLMDTYREALKVGFSYDYDKAINVLKEQRKKIMEVYRKLVSLYLLRTEELRKYAVDRVIEAKESRLSVKASEYYIIKGREMYNIAKRYIDRRLRYENLGIDMYSIHYREPGIKRDVSEYWERKEFPKGFKKKIYRVRKLMPYGYNPEFGYLYAIKYLRKAKEFYIKAVKLANFPIDEFTKDLEDIKNHIYRRDLLF